MTASESRLLPLYWKVKGMAHPAGEFVKGREKEYAVVQLDQVASAREVVYHEYIHELIALNFTRMPTWLNEGLAEFYGNSRFEQNDTVIGAPSNRVPYLQAPTRTPYPLERILSANENSPVYNDYDKAPMFYAESWALTHFLMFSENMGDGQRMNSYLNLLQKGADAQQAFQQIFGNLADIEKRFDNYIRQPASRVLVFPKVIVDMDSFRTKRMSPAETNAVLGGFYASLRDVDTAREKLITALAEDPKSALVQENMAFLDFDLGHDAEARREFDQAVALDSGRYLSVYYQAMMAFGDKDDADSLTKLDDAMQKVLQLNEQFAPAWVARSKVAVRRGRLSEAFQAAAEAQKLEPDRAGYLTQMAAILLLERDYANAFRVADAVVRRWSSSDTADAMLIRDQAHRLAETAASTGDQVHRLVGTAPSTDDHAVEADSTKYPGGTLAVEGVIAEVSCQKDEPMEIMLQSGDKTLTFHAGKVFSGRFSDSLWFGRDHFRYCYHLQGMKAIVRYRLHARGQTELVSLEILDDLTP